MILNDINDANRFVLNEIRSRKVQSCHASWINQHRNVFYNIVQENGSPKRYYLKYDRNPHYALGGITKKFKGAGVAINEDMFNKFIRAPRSDMLYANTLRIYHVLYDDLMKVVTDAFPQRFNDEVVVAVPFYIFRKWQTNISQD